MIFSVGSTKKKDFVRFSSKGQVIIPRWLRDRFNIQERTRAIVQSTPKGILLVPLTEMFIRKGRGIIKRYDDNATFLADWKTHKKQEMNLEDHQAR